MTKNSADFSPAVATFLFDPDESVRRATLNALRNNMALTDAAIAVAALAAVESEAAQKGVTGGSPYDKEFRVDSRLLRGAERMGDIFAARVRAGQEKSFGLNNALLLDALTTKFLLRSAPDASLSDEQKAQVLAAWETRRAAVPNPVTPAQLDAQIALARRAIYGDFKVGANFARIAEIAGKSAEKNFDSSTESAASDAEIAALSPSDAPDLLHVLQWRGGARTARPDSASAFEALARLRPPGTWNFLLGVAYDHRDNAAEYVALRALSSWDREKMRPHLEAFFADDNTRGGHRFSATQMAAALELAQSGEKRAVPVLMNNIAFFTFAPKGEEKLAIAAVSALSGQNFSNKAAAKLWWEREGSQAAWN